MYKLLFWIVVITGIVLYIRHQMKKRRLEEETEAQPALRRGTTRTVRCEHCGLHVPEDEAVRRDGHDFCGWEHAEEWLRKHPR